MSLIGCVFVPWGLAPSGASTGEEVTGVAAYIAKLAASGVLLALFETSVAKMRIFRISEFLGAALMLGLLGVLLLFVTRTLQ
jgi:formate hydrogenlyase subunit 4